MHSELAELLSEAGNMHVHLANALRIEADHLTAALTPGGAAPSAACLGTQRSSARCAWRQTTSQRPWRRRMQRLAGSSVNCNIQRLLHWALTDVDRCMASLAPGGARTL